MMPSPILLHTFTDAEVFSISLVPPLTIQMLTNEQLCKMLPTYRKQFADWGKIPTAYVLSKWETNFRQGVPTVAFVQPAAKKLWQTLSDILSAISRQACPDAFGDGDATTQLKQIKQFLQQAQATEDTSELHNEDLAGFFTSVFQYRFLQSFELMSLWYVQRNGPRAEAFTNAHDEIKPQHRSQRGSHKNNPDAQRSSIKTWMSDFPDLTHGVLMMNFFLVGKVLMKQQRGAPMGSPASAALCSMVVAVQGQGCSSTYKHLLSNYKFHKSRSNRNQSLPNHQIC